MKRRYIIFMMLLIVLLLTLLIYINKKLDSEDNNSKLYTRITINEIEGEYYSTIEESIELKNNIYLYTKRISYEEREFIIKKDGIFKLEENVCNLDGTKLIINDNELCSDEQCQKPFTRYTPKPSVNNMKNIDFKESLISIKNIEKTIIKDDIVIISILSDNTSSSKYKESLNNIVKEYNTKFYYLNLNKLSVKKQKEIKKEYDIEELPITLIFKEGKLIDKKSGNLTTYELHNLLTNIAIKSR